MNSSDADDESTGDGRLRRVLRSLAVPETPAGMESRVLARLRTRRVQKSAALASVAAMLLVGLFVWQPWRRDAIQETPHHQQPIPIAKVPREIPADDLAVLFAPPPVDSLDVLARRDAVSIAAISRMEGVK